MAENKKINILVPIAGKARRFAEAGYKMPKPLIKVCGEDIIDKALHNIGCVSIGQARFIFVVRRDEIQRFGIDQILRNKLNSSYDYEVVVAETDTEGALCTCLLARDYINTDEKLLIFTPDIEFKLGAGDRSEHILNIGYHLPDDKDGVVFTFKANSDAHSYAEVVDGKVVKTAEKEVISQNAAVGLYYFKNGSEFVRHAENAVANKEKTKNEYYICPIYNRFIQEGANIGIHEVKCVNVLGTPEDVDFYEKYVGRHEKGWHKKIGVCCDHSGFDIKEKAKELIGKMGKGPNIVDYGTYINVPCDYSDYCIEACHGLKRGEVDIVLGFCRTGNGMNICANKQDGIISALVSDGYTAKHAISHNCANFIAIPQRDTSYNNLSEIITNCLLSEYEGGRHTTRIRKFL